MGRERSGAGHIASHARQSAKKKNAIVKNASPVDGFSSQESAVPKRYPGTSWGMHAMARLAQGVPSCTSEQVCNSVVRLRLWFWAFWRRLSLSCVSPAGRDSERKKVARSRAGT
jgi:hypothetical protein